MEVKRWLGEVRQVKRAQIIGNSAVNVIQYVRACVYTDFQQHTAPDRKG